MNTLLISEENSEQKSCLKRPDRKDKGEGSKIILDEKCVYTARITRDNL